MVHVRNIASRGALILGVALYSLGAHAQSAPSGAHPRLWLDASTRSGLVAQASVAKSAVGRAAARCAAARNDPSDYSDGGWQGFEFVATLSGCLASWEASGSADDLTTALKYWNVLLDDYQTVGDGAGGDDVVTHDTGYAMRTFAPFAALAYDWLHDAAGVTDSLLAHARERFDAWATFYETQGYLHDLAGANYQAGYLFADTLMAIATGGEGGSASDGHWATVRDTIWGHDMAQALLPGGILDGADWAEGWQYGPLSVLEYALAARAALDNGLSIPGIGTWTNALVVRYENGLTPATKKMFAGGDTEFTTANLDPVNEPLIATIAGPSDAEHQAWARKLEDDLALTNYNTLFDALASARAGAETDMPATSATNFLSRGVGNWYARGDWTKNSGWSVFQCTHRLVADHEHNDAGNWVLTRGADDVVVDPSPYGSLSTLTGNAPAVDSNVLPSGYSPSQGDWGQATRLVWAKQSSTGVGVARCDYADQFRAEDTPSDVAHAIRDFIVLPNDDVSTVVLVDRVVTGDASRGLHLRVRTEAPLSLQGNVATATVGGSALTIRELWSTGGSSNVRDMPLSPDCSSDSPGTCDISRLSSGQEYRVDVPGPTPAAIHVIDATATLANSPASALLSGTGYRGVFLDRAPAPVAVIANDGSDAVAGTSLSYRVPARAGATHVVVDAPVNANGRSDVTASLDGANCAVTVVPSAGDGGGFDGLGLVLQVTETCAISESAEIAAPSAPGDAGTLPTGSGGAPSVSTPAMTGGAPSQPGNGASGTSNAAPTVATGGGSAETVPSEEADSAPGAIARTVRNSSSCAVSQKPANSAAASALALIAIALGRRRRQKADPFGFFRRGARPDRRQ